MEINATSGFVSEPVLELFGMLPDGKVVDSCEITNSKGMQLKVINYGATVTSLKIPLKNGQIVDVVLGFETLEDYLDSFRLEAAPYLGATVGRYAGRIHNSVFSLNGKTIQLNNNNNGNSLHGGIDNFSQKVWEFKKINGGENPSVTLSYVSANGEENYPGELTVELTYTLTEENQLLIEYKASTTEDTVVNLTHHSYFNLDGHDSAISEQELMVNSNKILETTSEGIPTGVFLDLKNHPFDFNTPKKCPSTIDNTFVLENEKEFAASLFSKKNNLKMTTYTNQPGVHIYVGGNCFDTVKGKENANYHALSGICFETQNFPDAPNQQHFPSAVLRKGESYYHKTSYEFESF